MWDWRVRQNPKHQVMKAVAHFSCGVGSKLQHGHSIGPNTVSSSSSNTGNNKHKPSMSCKSAMCNPAWAHLFDSLTMCRNLGGRGWGATNCHGCLLNAQMHRHKPLQVAT